jgi:hypothetical protein
MPRAAPPAEGAALDEIAASLGIARAFQHLNRTQISESDDDFRARVEAEIARRQGTGMPMPIAAQALTPVQAAIRDTILEATRQRDDVSLADIIVAMGTPAEELAVSLPAFLPVIMPILRRLELSGVIEVKRDPMVRGRRPAAAGPDPLERTYLLITRKRPAVVAPKIGLDPDLLYDEARDVAYLRLARISYDRIEEMVALGESLPANDPQRPAKSLLVAGEGLRLDLALPGGRLLGLFVQNAIERIGITVLAEATRVVL